MSKHTGIIKEADLFSGPLSYRYDGTFEGLLCCLYETYSAGELPENILGPGTVEDSLFGTKTIVTDIAKAVKVWRSIREKLGLEFASLVHDAFCTCLPDKELQIIYLLRKGYRLGPDLLQQALDDTVHRINLAVHFLYSESHLLKGFIRFSVHQDILITTIGPKNYVLPYLRNHFEKRYPSERFLIYDETHQMALVYAPYQSRIIPMDEFKEAPPDPEEQKFRALWRSFYEAIEIKPRHNERCRRTMMPKRYWRYMTEFKPNGGPWPLKADLPATALKG
jgi:probable DNA metabolism protein